MPLCSVIIHLAIKNAFNAYCVTSAAHWRIAIAAPTSCMSNECNKRYRSTTWKALTPNKNEEKKLMIIKNLVFGWMPMWERVRVRVLDCQCALHEHTRRRRRFLVTSLDSVCSQFLQFVVCVEAATHPQLRAFFIVFIFFSMLSGFFPDPFLFSRSMWPPGWSGYDRCNNNYIICAACGVSTTTYF